MPTPRPEASSTAVGYARVSTEEQVDEGVSLAAQEVAVRSYCDMRGLQLADFVADAGVSGGKPLGDRSGGGRVLKLVEGREVAHVVAYGLSRLFRDASDCLQVTGGWDRRGVSLHLVDLGGQAVDTRSAMGRFFLTVMAGAAEMERGLVAERTRAALAHKRAAGERVGQVPYGYRVGEDLVHLEPESAEQKVLERIRRLRAAGRSLRSIVVRLNTEGVPARGECWHLTTVARLARRSA